MLHGLSSSESLVPARKLFYPRDPFVHLAIAMMCMDISLPVKQLIYNFIHVFLLHTVWAEFGCAFWSSRCALWE